MSIFQRRVNLGSERLGAVRVDTWPFHSVYRPTAVSVEYEFPNGSHFCVALPPTARVAGESCCVSLDLRLLCVIVFSPLELSGFSLCIWPSRIVHSVPGRGFHSSRWAHRVPSQPNSRRSELTPCIGCSCCFFTSATALSSSWAP